jgi:hypothetical protein
MKVNHSILAAALCAGFASQAHAGFYVNDDAPVITAAEAFQKPKVVYASFAGTSAKLLGGSRAEIEAVADSLPNIDTIAIGTLAKSSKQMDLARRRVAAVKAVLLRHGYTSSQISTSVEMDPLADELDLDVKVTYRSQGGRLRMDTVRANRSAPQVSAISPQVPAMPMAPVPSPVAFTSYASSSPTAATALPASAAQGNQAVKLEFVKKIMAMASSKLISQESAIKLVNEYLANSGPAQPQTPSMQANADSMPVAPAAPQIVPFGEVPRVWTLAANKSLRDNIRDWAVTAGFSEPTWNASNLYQITYTSTYTGTFMEVLNQVSAAVPSIDFKVSRNTRRLEIVDHL